VTELVSSNRRIIFQSDNIRLILDEKRTEIVYVVFNDASFTWNGDHYWGEQFLARLKVTVLAFVTPEPNWYPPDDMKQAIPVAISAIAGRRVVTYGHSQGGFGALKYSRALSASVALAFCPLWSINPDDVGAFDQRTAQYYKPALKNGHRIEKDDLCPRSFLFFDPREEPDRRNADKICEGTRAERVLAPYCGHSVIAMAAESRITAALIALSQSPNATAAGLRRIVRLGRAKSPTYRAGKLHRLMLRGKRDRLFLERHLAGYPKGSFATVIGATLQFWRGDRTAAAETLRRVPIEAWLEHDLFAFWRIFSETNFSEGELIVSPLLKIKYPTDCLTCLHAVDTYIRHRMFAEALSDLELLARLPDAHRQAHVFSRFYTSLGRPELAAPRAAATKARAHS